MSFYDGGDQESFSFEDLEYAWTDLFGGTYIILDHMSDDLVKKIAMASKFLRRAGYDPFTYGCRT